MKARTYLHRRMMAGPVESRAEKITGQPGDQRELLAGEASAAVISPAGRSSCMLGSGADRDAGRRWSGAGAGDRWLEGL